MEKNKENPIKLLMTWAGKDKWYLVVSVLSAFLSGLFVIGPYIGIYRMMDAVLLGELTKQILVGNIILITITMILRQFCSAFLEFCLIKGHTTPCFMCGV